MNDVKVRTRSLVPGRLAMLVGAGLLGLMALTLLATAPAQGAATMDGHGAGMSCATQQWGVAALTDYWVESGDLACMDERAVYVFPQEVQLNHPLRYETCDGAWTRQDAASDVLNAEAGDLVCIGAHGYSVIPVENDGAFLRFPPPAPPSN